MASVYKILMYWFVALVDLYGSREGSLQAGRKKTDRPTKTNPESVYENKTTIETTGNEPTMSVAIAE